MDAVQHSSLTPGKIRLGRMLAKVFNVQSVSGRALNGRAHNKEESHEKPKKDGVSTTLEVEDEEFQDKMVKEAFLSKIFSGITSIKAAYAEMQFAQCPYNADVIQSSDQTIVTELKHLSELKQCYLKKQFNETSLLSSEIQEQKSLVKLYEITSKKLDSEHKLKESKVSILQEKLAEADRYNESLEGKLYSSGQLDNIRLSDFVSYYHQTLKSIRSFVRFLIKEMTSANWDLDAAASSIEPNTSFSKQNHKCFAFESFVCKQMFDDFTSRTNSSLATFCRAKYLQLVHPKMEASIFGNLDHRDLVKSGDQPDTPFFLAFSEMAKHIWLVRCMAISLDPDVAIFQARKGNRFSDMYMESVNPEALLLSEASSEPRVAFTVVPGFSLSKSVIQCQVYLS